ncbi:MAG TPA: PQQ-binding-like beta-propeller repeat protein [Vicinamibacteria bacterium]|nr:PQQ-binding-like beta-propeller repeat protein [Vicinamibacteria bacterium]
MRLPHCSAFAAVPAVLAAGFLFAPGAPLAADWPQWRGPHRDGLSRETGLLQAWGPSGPPLAWKGSGLGIGFSSVAVAAGRIYTMGDRDGVQSLVALNQADGKRLWSARVGPTWDDRMGGPRGTPTVDGDLVFAIGTEGDLVCVESATGKERWRKSLPRDFGGRMMSMWKFSESPLVDGDRVVFTPGGPHAFIVAVDKRTGRELWRTAAPRPGPRGREGAGYSSIVISNGGGVKQYVQLTGRGLVGVRADNGQLLWAYNRVANDVANIPTPIVKGDLVFASTGYQAGSVLLKLVPAAGGVDAQEVYFLEARTLQNHHGGLVLVGDHVYGGHGHNRGFPIAVELATGKVAWGGDIRNAGSGSAAVTAADGHLYFRYQNGVVLLIEATPQAYREKGSFTIPDVGHPSWPHPVVAGGRLYLREQDALYVYDVRRTAGG